MSARVADSLLALKTSLAEQLAALRGVHADQLPARAAGHQRQPSGRRLLRLPSRLGAAAPRGRRCGAPGPVLGAALAERRRARRPLEGQPARAGHEGARARLRPRAPERRRRARRRARCSPPTARPTPSPSPPTCSPSTRSRARSPTSTGPSTATQLVERGPWDLVLAADVLYTRENVNAASRLFHRLVAPTGSLILADPNRKGAQGFLATARAMFELVSDRGPDVSLHTLTPRDG